METSLKKFKEKVKILNKDFAQYTSDEEVQVFNTINLFESVDKLQLESNEYQYALSQKSITKGDYKIEKIKKVVPKSTITGKKEDALTLVEKEVDVRIIYKRKNNLGVFDCYTESPVEEVIAHNKQLFEKLS
jgi:type VI protein secretion system component VasA